MTITEDRKKNIDFTDALLRLRAVAAGPGRLRHHRIDDLAGKKVGVQQGTTGKSYAKDNATGAEIVVVPQRRRDVPGHQGRPGRRPPPGPARSTSSTPRRAASRSWRSTTPTSSTASPGQGQHRAGRRPSTRRCADMKVRRHLRQDLRHLLRDRTDPDSAARTGDVKRSTKRRLDQGALLRGPRRRRPGPGAPGGRLARDPGRTSSTPTAWPCDGGNWRDLIATGAKNTIIYTAIAFVGRARAGLRAGPDEAVPGARRTAGSRPATSSSSAACPALIVILFLAFGVPIAFSGPPGRPRRGRPRRR